MHNLLTVSQVTYKDDIADGFHFSFIRNKE